NMLDEWSSMMSLYPEFSKNRDFAVGFEGSFGDRHVNPRTLKARYLGNMVCCEGIVTKCSMIRPKVVRSVHYCPATKKIFERKYTDMTSYDAFPTSSIYPTEDENKNPLETEYGLSTYKDHQVFSIQELPESAPPGQLPRSLDIIADEDLADSCKPGDRVRVVGLYRCLPNKRSGFSTGTFRSIIIANNVQLLSKELQPNFEPEDIKNIRKMSRNKDIFSILARSLAPSIWGHEEVKKAILCLLLGGNEKLLQNGSRIRGDINVLLIGDPSVAKSQLLRYVLHTAPRAIATTGRGSSGVGLTAAVTTDVETGDRRLEAGAMVLADRGVVCIDEFDKMSDIDRTAIHEVMEQGRVTIAKAGIHAKLNARCSVLAAANPVFGRYDVYKSPMQNIGMQDSLLSRFDFIFVLLDEHEATRDSDIAEHVVKLHRYRTPGEADGAVLPMGAAVETLSTFDLDNVDTHGSTEIYEKNKGWCAAKHNEKVITLQFMRKYIHMAKAVKPKLTEEAAAYISECYAELRSFDTSKTDRERTMPVTARQLETLIRVSTAMAKARLGKTVERSDAESAYQLLHFACFKEKPKERLEMEERKRGAKHKDEESDEELSDVDENAMETGVQSMETDTNTTRSRRSRRRGASSQVDDSQTTLMADETMDKSAADSAPSPKRARVEVPAISVDRYKTFRKYLRKAFDDNSDSSEMVSVAVIRDAIQLQAGLLPFTEGEFEAAFEQLSSENIIMIVDDKVILI
uniref:DNA replication licensing factor MCM3 n=1 Tax=Parascaris univalens TaxID=6257 RepID=A0A915B2R2_PARUN